MQPITTMGQTDDVKRRKLDTLNCSQLSCGFFINKKNRYCPLGRKPDQEFCVHHRGTNDERIPCPLDPKHSIWKNTLDKHLLKCNSKPQEKFEYWHDLDCNVEMCEISHESLNQDDLLKKYMKLAESLEFDILSYRIRHHDGLNEKLSQVSIKKHCIQQSSLIGNMKEEGLLAAQNSYLEYGCGKAELSRYINLCIINDNPNLTTAPSFGLIDRGLNRMKYDSKMLLDSEKNNTPLPTIKRSRIDIKDLSLNKFTEDFTSENIVVVSKHLCGAATDLTIRSIINSNTVNSEFSGMLIAMCCRHVCDYKLLLPQSRDYLAQEGFATYESFTALKKFASWAVCGRKKGDTEKFEITKTDTTPEHVKDKNSDSPKEIDNILKRQDDKFGPLSFEEREAIGLKARRLIDESRLYALKSLLPDYNIKMFLYAEEKVTLENVCLCITKK